MATKYSFAIAVLVLSLISIVQAKEKSENKLFDVTKYGAKAGNEEINEALTNAWKEACASTEPSAVVIPEGEFLLNTIKLQGPCKAPIEFQLIGTLKAPKDVKQMKEGDQWITINYVNELTITGGGTFDGQGADSWECHKAGTCKKLPNNLSFNFLNMSTIKDVTTLNSKVVHVNVFGCNNMTFQNFTITAPGDSLNTDGIHIGKSKGINITDSKISTGDDCVSVGDGTFDLTITRVTCGPGHGISIGSLGKTENEEDVNGVHVQNCTFSNTTNGARVKTWPDSFSGVVTNIYYEDIIMNDVENPVVVDQEYCPHNKCTKEKPSKVKLNHLSFKNIRGTSKTHEAVKLLCSKEVPCQDVEVGDINLTYEGKEGSSAVSNCTNVQPKFVGKMNPPACGKSE